MLVISKLYVITDITNYLNYDSKSKHLNDLYLILKLITLMYSELIKNTIRYFRKFVGSFLFG